MSEGDRYWLLTWTTYGTWLPGDRRGFVGSVQDGSGPRRRHNVAGTDYDRDMPGLENSARRLMKGEPILLGPDQAECVAGQFRLTAGHRGWTLGALAVMANHIHVVVGGPETVQTAAMMRDFKSYASRALNRRWPKPEGGTWWTESGSRRPLPDLRAVRASCAYVGRQHRPLVVWVDEEFEADRGDGSGG